VTQRILLGGAASVTETLLDGQGALPANPPDTAEVTIINDAGTVLASGASAVTTPNPSEFTIDIDTSMTTQLDRLTLVWSHAGISPTTTTVEVVGGLLFSVEQLRAMDPQLQDATAFPTTAILNVRTEVEQALERHLGYALVPRFTHRAVSPGDHVQLHPFLRSIRSASSAGSSVDVSGLTFRPGGVVTGYTFSSPASIAYEHGLDGGDMDATRAALMLAKAWLLSGPIDDRTTVLASPDAGITQTLAVPGRGGSIFGIPSVDEWVQSNSIVAAA